MGNQTPLKIASGKVEQFQTGDTITPSWLGSFTSGQVIYSLGNGFASEASHYPMCQGRLTLTSGTPVTTSDTTGTTLYFTKYNGNVLGLYNGSYWQTTTITELSTTISAVAFATLTNSTTTNGSQSVTVSSTTSLYVGAIVTGSGIPNNTTIVSVNSSTSITISNAATASSSTVSLSFYEPLYDVFVYFSGVPTLYTLAWTNATTRASSLTTQDGVYVYIDGTPTYYRYVGTVGAIGVSSGNLVFSDQASMRGVWNAQNRTWRPLLRNETVNSWTYSGSFRQANGNTANQVGVVIGLSTEAIDVSLSAGCEGGSGAQVTLSAIGVDSTTAASGVWNFGPAASSTFGNVGSRYTGFPGIGYHYLAWLESCNTTATFFGKSGSGAYNSGLIGGVWA